MILYSNSISDLSDLATEIISFGGDTHIWKFEGEMGAGKTTIIKEVCRQLGVSELVSSPTFSLVNEYEATNRTIYHFDFYRIQSEEEVLDLGYEDYFYEKDAICLLEWASLIPNLLPVQLLEINIKVEKNERRTIQLNKYE